MLPTLQPLQLINESGLKEHAMSSCFLKSNSFHRCWSTIVVFDDCSAPRTCMCIWVFFLSFWKMDTPLKRRMKNKVDWHSLLHTMNWPGFTTWSWEVCKQHTGNLFFALYLRFLQTSYGMLSKQLYNNKYPLTNRDPLLQVQDTL